MRKTVNCDLAFDFALLAFLSEEGGSPPLLRRDGRSVALYGAESAPYRARGESRGRTEGQLSLSLGEKHRRASSDVTTSRIAQIRRTLIWLPGRLTEGAFKGKVKRKVKQLFIFYTLKAKPLFTSFPTQRKSAFRSANNEMTGGLASGGALKCGEHCQAPSHEVSRAYKRRFLTGFSHPD